MEPSYFLSMVLMDEAPETLPPQPTRTWIVNEVDPLVELFILLDKIATREGLI
jgi:hypothetical protein